MADQNSGSAASQEQLQSAKPADNATPSTSRVQSSRTESNDLGRAIDAFDTTTKAYNKAMAPGAQINAAEGAVQQINLWRAIRGILNLKPEFFQEGFDYLMAFALKNREGTFHEARIYRFLPAMTALSTTERTAFERTISLIINTCNPKTRAKTIQRIDLSYVKNAFPGSDLPEKLEEYYRA